MSRDVIKEGIRVKAVNQVVGKNFRKYRRAAGLTQEAIAEKANVTIEYLSKLEHGTYNARITTLIDLCRAVEITPTQLLADFFTDKSNGISEVIFEEVDKLTLEDQRLALDFIKRLSRK